MSKNKYERNRKAERIKDCKEMMTIKNLSSKKFKVTLEVIEGDPLAGGDFAITVHGGQWSMELKTEDIEAIYNGAVELTGKNTDYLTIQEGIIK